MNQAKARAAIAVTALVFCSTIAFAHHVWALVASSLQSNANISVQMASKIDSKIDDGIPTSGNVQAVYLNGSAAITTNAPNSANDSATSCYNTNGNTYSTAYNGGAGDNCALSFKMQGGD
jgi:hypothetical protein